MNNAEAMEAIDKRISMRAYLTTPIEQEKLDQIQAVIDEANAEPELNFQLYGPREGMDTALDLNARMFAGSSPWYVALVADDNPIAGDKVGYYGEKIALLATHLGLGCCWVASTYDAKTIRAEKGEGQILWDVMPLGYAPEKLGFVQNTIRGTLRAKDKRPMDLIKSAESFADLPNWIKAALTAVVKGPSAVNAQPVVFTYADGEVTADASNGTYAVRFNDLGIAKYNFQVAAEAHGVIGTWEWGEGGAFVIE